MRYNYLIRNANIHDGSGEDPYISDIGIIDDKIIKIGDLSTNSADEIIDVSGMIISPGFINMLSWSVESLIDDGRAMGTITQGVTLEVMGESMSWGPLNEYLKGEIKSVFSANFKYDITWNTLGEYLQMLENKGVSTNIASFIGAATVRMYYLKQENREPTTDELNKMKNLVDVAMKEGAMGLGSALIYPPAFFAKTDELVELCKVVSKYNGMYISHIRSEGINIECAIDEFIDIVKRADVKGEIYHLKVAGKSNWHKLDNVINKINNAIDDGLIITTDCYLYTAAGTGLDSCLPPWVSEGGREKFLERLKDKNNRLKILEEMQISDKSWENLYLEAGPSNIIPLTFQNEYLKKFSGKSIKQLSEKLEKDPRDVIIDLLIEDKTRIGTIYKIMNEKNIEKKLKLPYMSFGSDGESVAPEGKILNMAMHPRSYGNFSKLISKYVRDRKIITLQEAIRKLTSLPAFNLGIKNRGMIKEGYYADIAIFDLEKMKDKATYENFHQLSEGMVHVFVNGVPVLKNSKHTGNTPGVFIKGPGYSKIQRE